MKKYVEVNCSKCLQCCRFHFYQGQTLSYKKLHDSFFFTRELCDTFFEKRGKNYLIKDCCRFYKDGLCQVHDSFKLPAICALFPFMTVVDDSGERLLVVDCNCPQWEVAAVRISEPLYKKELIELIKCFEVENRLDYFLLDELVECGYNLKVLDTMANMSL